MVNTAKHKAKGFTLLELVVSLLVIVILYGVLSVRLGALAESAERAAMYGVLGQVQQQINLRLAKFYIEGAPHKAKQLLTVNPFSWIAPLPRLYAGEVENSSDKALVAGRWYFDKPNRQLIYRVKRNNNIKIEGISYRNLRFVLKLNGRSADNVEQGAVYSIKIQTVTPFEWNP